MPIYCCKDCVAPKRHALCHGSCPEYIAEKAEHDRQKAIADKKKETEWGLNAQKYVEVNRAFKAYRKMKGL